MIKHLVNDGVKHGARSVGLRDMKDSKYATVAISASVHCSLKTYSNIYMYINVAF